MLKEERASIPGIGPNYLQRAQGKGYGQEGGVKTKHEMSWDQGEGKEAMELHTSIPDEKAWRSSKGGFSIKNHRKKRCSEKSIRVEKGRPDIEK